MAACLTKHWHIDKSRTANRFVSCSNLRTASSMSSSNHYYNPYCICSYSSIGSYTHYSYSRSK
jgi:hypothetical protein